MIYEFYKMMDKRHAALPMGCGLVKVPVKNTVTQFAEHSFVFCFFTIQL